jgi:hypothetical protein
VNEQLATGNVTDTGQGNVTDTPGETPKAAE